MRSNRSHGGLLGNDLLGGSHILNLLRNGRLLHELNLQSAGLAKSGLRHP